MISMVVSHFYKIINKQYGDLSLTYQAEFYLNVDVNKHNIRYCNFGWYASFE